MFLHKGLLRNNETGKKLKKKTEKYIENQRPTAQAPVGVPFISNYIMIFLHYGIAPIVTRRMQTRGYLDNLRAFKAFRHMRWCSFRKHPLLKSYKNLIKATHKTSIKYS